jgi:hypothetical protein
MLDAGIKWIDASPPEIETICGTVEADDGGGLWRQSFPCVSRPVRDVEPMLEGFTLVVLT